MEHMDKGTWAFFQSANIRAITHVCALHLLVIFVSTSYAVDSSTASSTITSLKVLDSVEVDYGTYSIFYNRVETPTLKPQPAPIPTVASLASVNASATDLQTPISEEVKTQVVICGDATVYDDKTTVLRWWQDGGQYVYRSNVNFIYLRSLSIFETQKTSYFVMLAVADGGSLPADYLKFPLDKGSGEAQFGLVSEPQAGSKHEMHQFMRDIHAYYATHKDSLISAYQQSEQVRIAKEQWDKDHPPQHQNFIIQYFPIKSNMPSIVGGNNK